MMALMGDEDWVCVGAMDGDLGLEWKNGDKICTSCWLVLYHCVAYDVNTVMEVSTYLRTVGLGANDMNRSKVL